MICRPAVLLVLASLASAHEPGRAVRLVDVTGDGRPDRLELAPDGTLSVAVHAGGRRFLPTGQELPRVAVADVLAADLDGDGFTDVYLVSPDANVALLGDGRGWFREDTERLGLVDRGAGVSAEHADLDGDGQPDLLLRNRGGDVLFWNEGGRYARDAATPEGVREDLPATGTHDGGPAACCSQVPGASVDGGAGGPGAGATATGTAARTPASAAGETDGTAGLPVSVAPPSAPAVVLAPSPVETGASVPPPLLQRLLELFVLDDAGEVGPADIVDGSLTGPDVSTSSGDVSFTGASLTVSAGGPDVPAATITGGSQSIEDAQAGTGAFIRGGAGAGVYPDATLVHGGTGLHVVGGDPWGLRAKAGTAIVATGGPGLFGDVHAEGGIALEAFGALGYVRGGDAIRAVGGDCFNDSDSPGRGLYAEGGKGAVGGAYGVHAVGGEGDFFGATGVWAEGRDGSFGGGHGLEAWGGDGAGAGSGVRGHGGMGDDDPGDGVWGRALQVGGHGVFSSGDFAATGVKAFVQPHPTDPSREIRFVALEGNEAGTYFRGTAQLAGGVTAIIVPEDFRLVTEAVELTVQLTPLGAPATLWVASQDLERIVVGGSDDVAFHYLVQGVRRGFRDLETIAPNRAYVPTERGVPFGAQYRAEHRRLLVENGTLEADFTPDEATAAALGWRLSEPPAPASEFRSR